VAALFDPPPVSCAIIVVVVVVHCSVLIRRTVGFKHRWKKSRVKNPPRVSRGRAPLERRRSGLYTSFSKVIHFSCRFLVVLVAVDFSLNCCCRSYDVNVVVMVYLVVDVPVNLLGCRSNTKRQSIRLLLLLTSR